MPHTPSKYVYVTRQQRRLAMLVLAHPDWSAARCLTEAGYSYQTKRHAAGRTIAALGTQQAIGEILDEAGATPSKMALRLAEGLDYKKTQRLAVSMGKGEPSEVQEFEDVDNAGRLAAAMHVAELRGLRKSGTDIRVQVQVNVLDQIGKELFPLVAECLDPAKRERWSQGMSELVRRYSTPAPSAILDVSPSVDPQQNATGGILVSQKAEKPAKNGKNGGNGANGNGQH